MAVWTGDVSLKKVVKYCGGVKQGAKHIEFFGADTYKAKYTPELHSQCPAEQISE